LQYCYFRSYSNDTQIVRQANGLIYTKREIGTSAIILQTAQALENSYIRAGCSYMSFSNQF